MVDEEKKFWFIVTKTSSWRVFAKDSDEALSLVERHGQPVQKIEGYIDIQREDMRNQC
jgi:hypothetical protein